MHSPFFSIVLPTKDRPQLVDKALCALTLQSFNDFEVIVSDNYTTDSCFDVCEKYKEKLNIRYFKPEKFLIMSDNFEFAFAKAKGLYVSIYEDKFMFYPFTLSYIKNIIANNNPDSVSYPYDFYVPNQDEKGEHQMLYNSKTPYAINSQYQIKKHLSFEPFTKINSSSIPNTGYIMSGFFKKEFLEEVKKNVGGSLFLPPAPDLTSQIFISFYIKHSIHTGFPMVLRLNSNAYSVGGMQQKSASFMKESWDMLDPTGVVKAYIPYPDLTASLWNFIAACYQYAISFLPDNNGININKINLLFRIREDINNQDDKDEAQRLETERKISNTRLLQKIRNYINVRFGIYFNKYIIFDYIGCKLCPINKTRKYKMLKEHRRIVDSKNQARQMLTIEECLIEGANHYQSLGFLSYNGKTK